MGNSPSIGTEHYQTIPSESFTFRPLQCKRSSPLQRDVASCKTGVKLHFGVHMTPSKLELLFPLQKTCNMPSQLKTWPSVPAMPHHTARNHCGVEHFEAHVVPGRLPFRSTWCICMQFAPSSVLAPSSTARSP